MGRINSSLCRDIEIKVGSPHIVLQTIVWTKMFFGITCASLCYYWRKENKNNLFFYSIKRELITELIYKTFVIIDYNLEIHSEEKKYFMYNQK